MDMMLNVMTPTDLEKVLERTHTADTQEQLFNNLKQYLEDIEIQSVNQFDFDALETHRIYHIDQIKKVSIQYRLRFLDSKFFKGTIPDEAQAAVARLETTHRTTLADFKIMAPSIMFRLAKTDDPLLFAPMGNDYFYLIHKWGNDLHPLRRLRMWPFMNIWNLLLMLLVVSGVLTSLTPLSIFTKNPDSTSFWMLYFFMFKAVVSIVLFYGFALGKNFNPAIWNSKYNKS